MACNISLAMIFCFFIFSILMLDFMSCAEADNKVRAMYILGDSLVDVGNNNYLNQSRDKANFPHNGIDFPGSKPTGRFSNGKNLADFIAEKVGVAASPPYLSIPHSFDTKAFLTGVSFASAGAGIFNGNDSVEFINFPQQVDYYQVVSNGIFTQLGPTGSQQHRSESLFTIVIGSSDLLRYFKSVSKSYTPQQFVDQMISTLKQSLKIMYNFGASKFLVPGTGMIGCYPSLRHQNKNGECNEEANQWAQKYNDGLKTMLKEIKSETTNISYTYFDTYSAFQNFIQKPATYGFKEVKSACCGLGKFNAEAPCTPKSHYCSNRSDHLFWDLYHPTETTSKLLVDMIFEGPQELAFPINLKQLVAA